MLLSYCYASSRVFRALGLEPQPPYPKGRVLEQGDWSLLDAVRDRPRMWRDVDGRTGDADAEASERRPADRRDRRVLIIGSGASGAVVSGLLKRE